MPVVVLSRPDDEIADLIERVRSANDPDIGLVVPAGSRSLQTPLNARLLSQFCRTSGTRAAIISDDPRVQQLATGNGFTVYASQLAFERGIELLPARSPMLSSLMDQAGASTATAVQEAPPSTTPAAPAPPPPPRIEPRRQLSVPPPGPSTRSHDRRRMLYFAGAAVAIIGLLLFFTLSPSAKITLTVAATPVSVNQTLQGSTDPIEAAQADHILTTVASSTAMQPFAANPTGHSTLPATPANATEVIVLTAGSSASDAFTLHVGDYFQAQDLSSPGQLLTFVVTKETNICIGSGPPGTPPPNNQCNSPATGFQPWPPNDAVSVQAQTAGAKWNVAAGAINVWTQNPYPQLSATNPEAAKGGADPKQVTVASASDVASWNTQQQQIETQLTQQINADLSSKASGKTLAQDPGGGGKTLTFSVNPALPAAGAQYANTQITITATAKAAFYDLNAVRKALVADLKAQVAQGEQLASKIEMQTPSVTQAGDDGTVILSGTASGYSQPQIDFKGLKSQLAGKNPGDVQRIIQNRIDHVQSVEVSEFPFKLFFMPFFSSRIEIDENFAAQAAPSS